MSPTALFRLALVLLLLLLIDWYAWRGIHTATGQWSAAVQRVLKVAYWTVSFAVLVGIAFGVARVNELHSAHNRAFIYTVIGIFVLFLLPKLVIVVFHLLEDILELLRLALGRVRTGCRRCRPRTHGRLRFLSQLGLALAAIPFAAVLYGLTRGRRNFNVAPSADHCAPTCPSRVRWPAHRADQRHAPGQLPHGHGHHATRHRPDQRTTHRT
jgi:hypothetical protein